MTADTAFKTGRRAFADKGGGGGEPQGRADLFGKAPEVLVHGSENWRKARNTGNLADPNNLPGGAAVGKIKNSGLTQSSADGAAERRGAMKRAWEAKERGGLEAMKCGPSGSLRLKMRGSRSVGK